MAFNNNCFTPGTTAAESEPCLRWFEDCSVSGPFEAARVHASHRLYNATASCQPYPCFPDGFRTTRRTSHPRFQITQEFLFTQNNINKYDNVILDIE